VTFDEMVSALEALEGQPVTARVVGNRADAAPLMMVDGLLQRMRSNDAPHGRAAEEAITFVVGENGTTLVLWPSCFMECSER
jgi:hypothetical protein